MVSSFRFWAVIPAAGNSRRMGASTLPKQYLSLAGRSVLEWSLAPLLQRPECAGVVVALASGDRHWHTLAAAQDRRIHTVMGGSERADSVRQGLRALESELGDEDWVLVHDAARPCLQADELTSLLSVMQDEAVGGLLAVALVDTLKRADESGRVAQTVNRAGLWRALTPQMFRYGILNNALAEAQRRGVTVTDEAQAVELLGLRPKLVPGSADNIKITVPGDLQRAQHILATRQEVTGGTETGGSIEPRDGIQ